MGTRGLGRVALAIVVLATTLATGMAVSVAQGTGSELATDVAAHDVGEHADVDLVSSAGFDAEGGHAVFEPGTPNEEPFSYDLVDHDGGRLVGLTRSNPVHHSVGTFVQAVEAPTPAATPSESETASAGSEGVATEESPADGDGSSVGGEQDDASSAGVTPGLCDLLNICHLVPPIDTGCAICDELIDQLVVLFESCTQTDTCDVNHPGCGGCDALVDQITDLIEECTRTEACADPASALVSELLSTVCGSDGLSRSAEMPCIANVLGLLDGLDLFNCDPKGVGESCSEYAARLTEDDVCGANVLGECDDARFALADDPACSSHTAVCAPPPNPCAHLQDECIPALPDVCRTLNGCLPDLALDVSEIALDDMTLIVGPGSTSTSIAPPTSGGAGGGSDDPKTCYITGSSYQYDEPVKGSNSSVADETYSVSYAGKYLYAEAYSHASTGRGSATASTQETFIRARVGGTFAIRGKRAPNLIDIAVTVPYNIAGKLSASRESVPCPIGPCELETQALAKAAIAIGVRDITQDADVMQDVIFEESEEGRGESFHEKEDRKVFSTTIEKGHVYAVWAQVRTYASVDPGVTGPLLRSRATADFEYLYRPPPEDPQMNGVWLDYIRVTANNKMNCEVKKVDE